MKNSIKNASTKLLNKSMTRKEFLAHVGMGVLTVTGVTAALNAMNSSDSTGTTSSKFKKKKSGYGGSAYGA